MRRMSERGYKFHYRIEPSEQTATVVEHDCVAFVRAQQCEYFVGLIRLWVQVYCMCVATDVYMKCRGGYIVDALWCAIISD